MEQLHTTYDEVSAWVGGLLVRVFVRLEVDLINNGSFTMCADWCKS